MSIAYYTGTQYISAFDDHGKIIMGCEANELAVLWTKKDDDPGAAGQIEALFKAAQFRRWRLRLRSKKEIWNDEERVKAQIMECQPVPFVTDGRSKLDQIFQVISGAESASAGLIHGGA